MHIPVERTIVAPFGAASDVRVAPDGKQLSFVLKRELYIATIKEAEISAPHRISPRATETIAWGIPDFIAAEEIHRQESSWWSPDSTALIFTGADEGAVNIWYVSNPTNPGDRPRTIRYPQAGTPNARASLFWWRAERELTKVIWDHDLFPYLVQVRWMGNEPTVIVQDRAQRSVEILRIDPHTGETSSIYRKHDPLWVELIEGVPLWSKDGRVVDAPDGEPRRLRIGNRLISPYNLEVRKVIGQLECGGIVYLASPVEDARETHVWVSNPDREDHVKLSKREGVYGAEIGGDTVVIFGSGLADRPHVAEVVLAGKPDNERTSIKDYSARISNQPEPKFRRTEQSAIDYAIIYPRDYKEDGPLPVLMDPYGGPWVQRCIKSSLAFTVTQWFADQGFAVIVADGRGTPGRGRTWERAVAGDLITKAVEDQIAALDDAVEAGAPLDIDRVAVRGWSFGGYLAIMSVLLRPDRFHVAVAGAPVTDWRYYDTHYTERYLGQPDSNAEVYDRCSAVAAAERLTRPLLLIHGLNDDNVVIGHTLRLSQALFAAGKEHYVLPLTNITHMAASEQAAEHLLCAQLEFIQKGFANR